MCRYQQYTNGSSQVVFVSEEHTIFGSNRHGAKRRKDTLRIGTTNYTPSGSTVFRQLGMTDYELSNHLGNFNGCFTFEKSYYKHESRMKQKLTFGVLVTATYKKVYKTSMAGNYFEAEIVSITDYYPRLNDAVGQAFGSQEALLLMASMPRHVMQTRSYAARAGRFGFNGIEKNSDINEEVYDSDFRLYDARLARWTSVDPEDHYFPYCSPYNFNFNSPIIFIDKRGDNPVLSGLAMAAIKLVLQIYKIASENYHEHKSEFKPKKFGANLKLLFTGVFKKIDYFDVLMARLGGALGAIRPGTNTFFIFPKMSGWWRYVVHQGLNLLSLTVDFFSTKSARSHFKMWMPWNTGSASKIKNDGQEILADLAGTIFGALFDLPILKGAVSIADKIGDRIADWLNDNTKMVFKRCQKLGHAIASIIGGGGEWLSNRIFEKRKEFNIFLNNITIKIHKVFHGVIEIMNRLTNPNNGHLHAIPVQSGIPAGLEPFDPRGSTQRKL